MATVGVIDPGRQDPPVEELAAQAARIEARIARPRGMTP